MRIIVLDDSLWFPSPQEAHRSGLLCVGGDLRPERMLTAYRMGIFPWPHPGLPLMWHSPDPRFVLLPGELHVPRTLRRTIRRAHYEIRFDTAFADVVRGCAKAQRPGQQGTWITDDLAEAYQRLHAMGYAHSAEAWQDGRLVGGLYGVALGGCFCGESMFATAPDASKAAFVTLVAQLARWGFTLVDCQVHTEHLERFGARSIVREEFLHRLAEALALPTRQGVWRRDAGEGEGERQKRA
jgi:leucyl/phenylalanyl-tRNA--protein transferase